MPLEGILGITMNLVTNTAILLSLVFIYATCRAQEEGTLFIKIGIGIAIAMFVFLLMSNPWRVEEGLFFDARTVMLSVSGMFFGALPTSIAATIVLIYRLTLGGSGVYSGVLTIMISSAIGIFWPKIREKFKFPNIYVEYLSMGFIVHVLTVLCFFTVPYPRSIVIIQNTWIPYLIVFPIVTMFLSFILNLQKEAYLHKILLKEQQRLLQSSIDSTPTMEIYALDKNYNYLALNDFHKSQMQRFYNKNVEIGKNYLNVIEDEDMGIRLKNNINRALSGESFKVVIEVETEKGKYLEEYFTPIENDNKDIIGVTVFSEDITERYNYQQNMIYISYHDVLTGLYNRRFYQEQIEKLDKEKHYPFSIAFGDINGLKLINDSLGHAFGDKAIIRIANTLNNITKEKNIYIARIGGDEFAILMPNTPLKEARALIDKTKTEINKIVINSIHVSMSFGIATQIGAEDFKEIITKAENEMYAHKLHEIASQRSKTVSTIMNALLAKNPREKTHSDRVANICVGIGTKMKMSNDELKLLKMISTLHDIGKIAIDDGVLNKPGKLTTEEWEQIKRHPEIGYRILSSTPEYASIAEDILSHHERYDGNGYPRGLKGEEIPIRARIIALADSYDAMTSDRPYRIGMSHEEAIEEITRCRGTQFDPKITDIFLELYNERIF